MRLSYETVRAIEANVGLPAYVIHEEVFAQNLRDIGAAFRQHYPHVQVAYALKANYLPYLCTVARQQGAMAEVVSGLEYSIARRAGFAGEEIIFNGPLKREADLRLALQEGALIQIDSLREAEMLARMVEEGRGKRLAVGLRLNTTLVDEQGESLIYGGKARGRFGLLEDELAEALRMLSTVPVDVVSLHGHASSQRRLVMGYRQIVKQLLAVRARYDIPVRMIDVGGGFFGPVPEGLFPFRTPRFDEYAQAIGEELMADEWVRSHGPLLVIEPGVSVCAAAMSYVTAVHGSRMRDGVQLVQADGMALHVRPSMHSQHLPYHILQRVPSEERVPTEVVGATCMETDLLLADELPRLAAGDYIAIDNVGAYTVVMAPTFIQHPPSVAAIDVSGRVLPVRRGQDFAHFAGQFNWL